MRRFAISILVLVGSLCAWWLSDAFLRALEIGPEPVNRFSDNFHMIRGTLYYHPHPENRDIEQSPIHGIVESFYVQGEWLVGKTKDGFFAIDLDTEVIHYPVSSKAGLDAICGVHVSAADWYDEHDEKTASPFLVHNASIHIFRKGINVCFGLGFVVVLVLLSWWTMRGSRRWALTSRGRQSNHECPG